MKRLVTAFTLLVALVTFSIAPAATMAASPAQQTNSRTLQLTNVIVEDALGAATGTFTGTLEIVRFVQQNGQLAAVGRLAGNVTNTATGVVTPIASRLVTFLVTPGQSSCTILDLELGPIDLNLLGLRIQTNQINLLITAEPGPGNLLGNLLCAVAGLLDRGGPLSGLVGLLNNILRNLPV